MISLPAGFDVALLFSDFFDLAAPFVGLALLISCGVLAYNLLARL